MRERRRRAVTIVEIKTDPNNALFLAAEGNYDLIIVSRGCRSGDFAATAFA